MNFNIYLDSALGTALQQLAKRRKVTRNALIRQAVEELVKQGAATQAWSAEVMRWEGDPRMDAFESQRARLGEPERDPLA